MDALSEMEKNVNSKVKTAVQKIKVDIFFLTLSLSSVRLHAISSCF